MIKFTAVLFLICSVSCSRSDADRSASYFRQTNVYTTDDQKIYDRIDWKVKADGPIRSSAVYGGGTLFFGTAKGTLYAVDQAGKTIWTYRSDHAIQSTAAYGDGKVYFCDNKQTLFCLDASGGQEIWKIDFQNKLPYDWGFDYYYASPVIVDGTVYVGADDGFLYAVNARKGNVIWKFNAHAVIRSTPAVSDNRVYFGDVGGIVYALNANDGKEIWTCKTKGVDLKNEEFGFDRRAILAAPAVEKGICVVGSRDGFLYGIDAATGRIQWSDDYEISWVISSALIKDSMVVVGTSDGHFVNALNLFTGKEIWRFRNKQTVWSSAIAVNDRVYVGSGEGILYVLDLASGKKVSEVRTRGNIFSSPVLAGSHVAFGNDEGIFYALKGAAPLSPDTSLHRYVFWQRNLPPFYYFRNGVDTTIRDYLKDNGYALLDTLALIRRLADKEHARLATVVFASNFFPDAIIRNGKGSVLTGFLDAGGTIVVLGINPALYDFNNPNLTVGFNFSRAADLLSVRYGPDDLRSFHGHFSAFPTPRGLELTLPEFWMASCSVEKGQVDEVLGLDENGYASAWIKHFGADKNGSFIQAWVSNDKIMDYNFIRFLHSPVH